MSTSCKSIYVAGPMTGYPDFNFRAFDTAAYSLRRQGWEVFNPAEKESETLSEESRKAGDHVQARKDGFDFREVFTWDTSKVIEADAIFMLPGWEQSPGACAEHAIAVAMKRHFPEYEIIYA